MKICLVTNLYEPYTRGGAEKIVKLTAQGLSRAGLEVVVVASRPYAGIRSLSAAADNGKIKVYRFFPLNIFYYLNDYKHSAAVRLIWHFFDIFNWHSRQQIKKVLKQEKPEVVITHNLKGIGYLIPGLIKKMKLRHIHVLHDVQYAVPSGLIIKDQEDSFLVTGFLTQWYQKICRKLFDPVGTVISPSKWLLDFYDDLDYFEDADRQVIPNPVWDADKPTVVTEVDNRNKLLFLGQIEAHKGIDLLLEVMKTMPQVNLRVAGNGSLFKLMKERFNLENVEFLGRIDSAAVEQELKRSDFVVVPSLCYENSPTVIYEAFNAGRPVIAANIGGVAELVNRENGFVFEAGNSVEMKEKIDQAVRTTEYSNLSKAAKNTVLGLSLTKYIDKLEQMW